MGEMKSAFEKAMEKVEKLGKASPEELLKLEYVPKGNVLAARYLKEENYDLDAELTRYKGSGVRKYLIQGAQEIFLSNITLPRSNRNKEATKRAMGGIMILKQNQRKVEEIFSQMGHLLNYYEQARQQAHTQIKKNFEMRLANSVKALEQQIGTKVKINIELQPQFQEEWRKVSAELDSQYEKVLEEQKQEILRLA